jgi:peptidyl-prolyl cis-trans isomerase C
MSCSARDTTTWQKPAVVGVNGVAIPRDAIRREVQNHPAATPIEAWKEAARALVVRELLLQEVQRLEIPSEPLSEESGRRETDEEAMIRTLIQREVRVPTPDTEVCRRFYEQNRRRFRSSDIYEAAHILIAAPAGGAAYDRAREEAAELLAELRAYPERFAALARARSACPSAAQDGNLGQITAGQTTPEFEAALARTVPGALSAEPVATRYGFHIIRLERKIEGRELPFEAAAERIARYLAERVERRAVAQYIACLASRAAVTGVDLADAEAYRAH